jgi:hypothetical protein
VVVFGRRAGNRGGLVMGHSVSGNQEDLDLIVCSGSSSVESHPARTFLLTGRRSSVATLVCVVRMGWHEPNHLISGLQLHRFLRGWPAICRGQCGYIRQQQDRAGVQ